MHAQDCCCPRGIKSLFRQVTCADDCKSGWFLSCVSELAAQVDWPNFDQELRHSRMRATLSSALGKTIRFEHAACLDLAANIAERHRQFVPEPMRRPRGRPAKPRKRQRRIDAWTVFVASRPIGDGAAVRDKIRSGDHLRDLARVWRDMSDADREPFARLAIGKRSALHDEDSENEGSSEGSEDMQQAATGAWGLGNQHAPMSGEAATSPAYSESLDSEVEQWLGSLGSAIMHDEGALPTKTDYDNCCSPFLCSATAGFADAESLQQKHLS